MSCRKYPGNDLENYSDGSSECRQQLGIRHIGWQVVPDMWKARLATVDSHTDGITRRLVPAERRQRALDYIGIHDEEIASQAGAGQRLDIKWSEVLWRKSMQDCTPGPGRTAILHHALNSLWDAHRVQTDC